MNFVLYLEIARHLYVRQNFAKLGEISLADLHSQVLYGQGLVQKLFRCRVGHLLIAVPVVLYQLYHAHPEQKKFVLILIIYRPEGLRFFRGQIHVFSDKKLLVRLDLLQNYPHVVSRLVLRCNSSGKNKQRQNHCNHQTCDYCAFFHCHSPLLVDIVTDTEPGASILRDIIIDTDRIYIKQMPVNY